MKFDFIVAIALLVLFSVGCDIDINETASPTTPATSTMPTDRDVNVDVETPAEARIDRREERRENLRDAIGNVDVQVGDGGVNVDVNGE